MIFVDSIGTMTDHRNSMIDVVVIDISMFLSGIDIRVVDSDRLPSYSESTLDIEVVYKDK